MEKSLINNRKKNLIRKLRKMQRRVREFMDGKTKMPAMHVSYKQKVIIPSIQLALSRIADGSYGRCLGCGSDMNNLRLLIRPEATHCGACSTIRSRLD